MQFQLSKRSIAVLVVSDVTFYSGRQIGFYAAGPVHSSESFIDSAASVVALKVFRVGSKLIEPE